MAEPTAYDLQQDAEINELQKLIRAEYDPPAGAQYSYPVASQGITQDQWQQMMLSMGDGAIVTEDSENFFRLVKHDTDAETNQRNTLIMKVADNTGRNEASLAGFYFRQTEDIELPFPPVTTTTVYHVTVTYDPRKFKTEPLRLEVWAGAPPRAQGQRHLVLRTVRREPNQLLSQAPISTLRHYVSPVITAVTEAGLPDAKDVLYGTLGIVRSQTGGGNVIAGTGAIYEARGVHGWHNLLQGPVENVYVHAGNLWTGTARCRWRQGGLDVRFNINYTGSGSSGYTSTMIQLPSKYRLSRDFYTTVFTTDGPANFIFEQTGSVIGGSLHSVTSRPGWTRGNVFIPDTHITIN